MTESPSPLTMLFSRHTKRLEKKFPRVVAVHDRVAKRPRIAAYLASERRIPFNEQGIFRHYRELVPLSHKPESVGRM